jgi:hypothetical protein
MLKVGTYKQQKYEEGVQKIQTSIDNVAGLDIANVGQQKYLQSKLNTLGNNLRSVAAGDFSDFSLVNSVNGMTKDITKDENVINAVSSTAKLRAGYKKREALSKKGLTDKNNDDYYDQFASKYINSTDLKESFNADYVPYTNIIAKVQDALKLAGENTIIAEQLFVIDPETKKPMIDPKTKRFMYADAKTIEKLVTNKPAALAAITNVLNSGDVKQQLGIDGWATYRNTDVADLLSPMKSQYDEERDKLKNQSLEITAFLTGTNLSNEQIDEYVKAQCDIEASIVSNDDSFRALSQQAETNPEQFKQNFYTQEYKQRLINQFTSVDEEHTTGTNPALQAEQFRQTFAFNEAVERNKVAYQNQTLAIAKSADKRGWIATMANYKQDPVTMDWYKVDTSAGSKKGTIDASNPLYSGTTSGDKVSAINIMTEDINTLSKAKGDISFSMYADLMRANANNYKLTDQQILASVNSFAKKGGVTPSVYLDRWAKNIVNKYDEAGIKPPPGLQDELNNYLATSKSLNIKKTLSDTAEAQANDEAGVTAAEVNLLKGKKTLKLHIGRNELVLEPKDMVQLTPEMISIARARMALRNPNFPGESEKQIQDLNLTTNQMKVLQNWDRLTPGQQQLIMAESHTYDQGSVNRKTHNAALSKSNELFNEKLSKIVGVTDVKGGSLPMYTADQIKSSVAAVSSFLAVGDRNFGPGTTKESMQLALDDPTNIAWTGKKPTNATEEWTGTIKVTSKGKEYTITNVNHDELESFTNLNLTNYVEKPVQDLINANRYTKSTNMKYAPNSTKAWTTAYWQSNEVNPEVTKAGWRYRADAVKANGGYRLVNYVKPPGAKSYTTIYGGAVAKEEGMLDDIFKTSSPKDLENLYMMHLQNKNK